MVPQQLGEWWKASTWLQNASANRQVLASVTSSSVNIPFEYCIILMLGLLFWKHRLAISFCIIFLTMHISKLKHNCEDLYFLTEFYITHTAVFSQGHNYNKFKYYVEGLN